ncbi:oligopeptide/dipeptide ABC transporter ATP-binding protein [Aurantimonas sp. C2-6-R+9]|uniref:ABC transporter ATP-binding protein n=1 Tax=unclassified Aurantimonas TaxID=2638230 RepID=UPI002E16FEDE|nr:MULTISPECIES: oligopeptide/dipeptide ABC transporter ATP-binding protein [unclassified Aurantimonas]MEC5288973.1 oligopeptide/dipeptide ABC transporter ATP-binding protein [Aurantimonas sp. C2-3-R2]MEC5379452.1 oligopeptide/dipeptide ABC transporter ATP-binding protein [Aurantimonas sp. C2-6-R+9]MEC5410205.1 oligopeptide/dipeptide ABC transporter ATP-binding protein [Aurantimonas sp. C2-4-R8]
MSDRTLLAIADVAKIFGGGQTLFGGRKPAVHAVQSLSLDVKKGETLGIVGESGCGKSTLARLMVGLDLPTAGRITLDGRDLVAEAKRDRRALARQVQYVFQDPVASLNPRKTIRTIIEAPLIHLVGLKGDARAARLDELMAAVNLAPEFLERYPHEFSGGQAQRIGIARALAAGPELIVLDEPVSALDVSIQAQVLNLLDDLKDRFGLTYVFISHDLSVVESVSDRVAVMYFGRIAELGLARSVFAAPRHPYTDLLMRSAPAPGRHDLIPEDANTELPDPYNPPPGCAFYARCPNATDVCRSRPPALDTIPGGGADHLVACYHPNGG